MRFVPLLWSNLKRRKIRTVSTGLSILVAFLLIGALLSLRAGFSRGVDLTGADRLVVSQKTAVNQPMPLAYRDRLAGIPGVAAVTYLAAFRGVYQDSRNAFPQLAVDTATWFEMCIAICGSSPTISWLVGSGIGPGPSSVSNSPSALAGPSVTGFPCRARRRHNRAAERGNSRSTASTRPVRPEWPEAA
jgi:hypothetical protein